MISLAIEYIICYSSAFLIGMVTGIGMTIVIGHKPSPLAMRRRKSDSKRVY
jgi:hypothetical protein